MTSLLREDLAALSRQTARAICVVILYFGSVAWQAAAAYASTHLVCGTVRLVLRTTELAGEDDWITQISCHLEEVFEVVATPANVFIGCWTGGFAIVAFVWLGDKLKYEVAETVLWSLSRCATLVVAGLTAVTKLVMLMYWSYRVVVTVENRRCVRGGHEVLLESLEHAVFEDDKENEECCEDELDGDVVAAKMEIEKQLRQRIRP